MSQQGLIGAAGHGHDGIAQGSGQHGLIAGQHGLGQQGVTAGQQGLTIGAGQQGATD